MEFKYSDYLKKRTRNKIGNNKKVLCRNEKQFKEEIPNILKWYSSKVNNVILNPGFVSTSDDWLPVDDRLMFRITSLEQGSKAKSIIPIMEVFQPQRAINEKEVLFDKRTCFKIISIQDSVINLEFPQCLGQV